MAAKAAGLDLDDWLVWSASGGNYGGEREARAVWRSFSASGGVSAATLFRAAMDTGWTDASPPRQLSSRAASRADVDRPARATLDPRWLGYWRSLGAVRDIGRAYLESRACALPPADGDLRFDPDAEHPSGYVGPCLVALVTDVLTGVPISLHRTWVNADGSKSDVDPPRLLLGGHRKAGGVIRLWPDEYLTQGLAIAEGIETALSLARVFQPAWAMIDAGNLGKLPVLAGVDALTIAVDDDPAGIRAADTCAERWAWCDRDVTLVEVGHDRA
ncbi:toprim domain-containing protein [Paraburkholderia caribensis]|nr:toprim domain-containing protein [Paraburkholderia caribensis]